MKGKNRRQKKENSRTSTKKRRMGTGAVFALTFCAVLSIGMAGILVMTPLKGEGTDKQEKPEIADDKGSSFWEKMPEKEAQAEPVMEMEVQNTRYGHELADAEYMKENHILAWESSQADTVTFGFIGDMCLWQTMNFLLRKGELLRKAKPIPSGQTNPQPPIFMI